MCTSAESVREECVPENNSVIECNVLCCTFSQFNKERQLAHNDYAVNM